MPEPISWITAQRVAARVSGREPFFSSYLANSLEADFAELTRTAEALVAVETGLQAAGPATVRVADRAEWANANVASMRRLLRPITDRIAQKSSKSLFGPASRVATGTQLGVVLGWMSKRVLGQYDLLLLEDERPEDQDIVYYVGPNVLALEKRYAFPPREFRLWLALHECTHRAQFTGVPWLADYFREQVHSLLEVADASKFNEALKRVSKELREGRNPVVDGGLLALFASPEQQASLKKIYGLMSLLEGHGDVTMTRAGNDLIPSAERFHRVMHERRNSARGLTKIMQKLLGMETKMRQYAEGERFIEEVEKQGGQQLMRRVWESPEMLPDYEEIREPQLWIKRVQADADV